MVVLSSLCFLSFFLFYFVMLQSISSCFFYTFHVSVCLVLFSSLLSRKTVCNQLLLLLHISLHNRAFQVFKIFKPRLRACKCFVAFVDRSCYSGPRSPLNKFPHGASCLPRFFFCHLSRTYLPVPRLSTTVLRSCFIISQPIVRFQFACPVSRIMSCFQISQCMGASLLVLF